MPLLKDVGVDDGLAGHDVVMLQQGAIRRWARGRQDHDGQRTAGRLGLLVREDCRSCLARGRLGA